VSPPLRAGLVTWCSVGVVGAVGIALQQSRSCGDGADAFGCLGLQVLLAACGTVFVVVAVTMALRGRGLPLALVGTVVSLVAGYWLTAWAAPSLPRPSESPWDEAVDWLVLASSTALLAAGWAALPLGGRSQGGEGGSQGA
jgi:hypothetical protein